MTETVRRVEEDDEIDLLALAITLWRNAWIIICVSFICACAGFGYSYFGIPKQYESEIKLYVNNSSFSLSSTSFSISTTEISAAQKLVDTYIVILNARTTLEEVIEYSGLDYTAKELSEMITASAINSTEVFSVKVKSTSPEHSAILANAVSKVLPERVSDIVVGSDMKIVDTAIVPTVKCSPSYSKYTVLGGGLGFVLICAFYVIRDLLDQTVRSEETLEKNFDLPILTAIPKDGGRKEKVNG